MALDLFSRHGFHDTSIAHIAARAHVSRATVYQYFDDKRDVLAALGQRIEQQVVTAIEAWEPIPAAPIHPWDDAAALSAQLRTMIDTRLEQFLVAAMTDHVASTRLVLRSLHGHDDALRETTRRIESHVVDVVTLDVRAAMRFGWTRECDAEALAIFLLGGIEKFVVRAVDADETSPVDRSALIREIGEFIFFGLAGAALTEPSAAEPRREGKGSM